jgi:hypothetical protein
MTIWANSNDSFADNIAPGLLDAALEWIRDNLDFEDVFPDWKKDIFLEFAPEDLFCKEDLETWAEDHGWVRDLEDDGK